MPKLSLTFAPPLTPVTTTLTSDIHHLSSTLTPLVSDGFPGSGLTPFQSIFHTVVREVFLKHHIAVLKTPRNAPRLSGVYHDPEVLTISQLSLPPHRLFTPHALAFLNYMKLSLCSDLSCLGTSSVLCAPHGCPTDSNLLFKTWFKQSFLQEASPGWCFIKFVEKNE